MQEQERREALAIPKRLDEARSLLARQEELEAAQQARFKELTQRAAALQSAAANGAGS